MKFVKKNKSSFSIEITPLIDIVFLLVIFFVVTSKVGESQFLSLDLPKTETFQYNVNQNTNEIIIMSNGDVIINDSLFNITKVEEIEQAIFEMDSIDNIMTLNAESESMHIWVVTIMDLLNKYGFNEVQIRTIEK
ncbi:MAG: biopolymer transporter ExbD [Gammaproteobacteria bacterium]|nr:biopolymer transporter ExbD [Gammaproteobacteria bacterium]